MYEWFEKKFHRLEHFFVVCLSITSGPVYQGENHLREMKSNEHNSKLMKTNEINEK